MFWLIAFLAVSVIFTYLVKRRLGTNAKTWFIASMIRTRRFLPLLDRLAKAGKIIDFIGDAGIIMGFGLIGAHFVFSKRTKDKRLEALWLAITALVLAGLFFLSFGGMFQNSMLKGQQPFFGIAFVIFGFAGFAIVSLLSQGMDIISKLLAGKRACPGVAPLIPGVSLPNVPITAPLHAWISLFLILIIHEGMHGVLARRAKVAIKSAGILLFGFLPIGAFVEPNESQLKRVSEEKSMRIYAAGAGANYITYLVVSFCVLLLFMGIGAVYNPWSESVKAKTVLGVEVLKVDQNTSFCGDTYSTSAYGVLEKGMLVKKANGKEIHTMANLQDSMPKSKAKSVSLTVEDKNGNVFEKTLMPNKLGLLGVTFQEKLNPKNKEPGGFALATEIIAFLQSFLIWFVLLNLLVAIVNFLPMEPFDGGKMAKIVFVPWLSHWKVGKKAKEKAIGKFFLIVILVILAINALPLFI